MILLAPAFTLFLLLAAPGGWRSLLTPRVVALAAAVRRRRRARSTRGTCATLWLLPLDPPDGVARCAAAVLVRRHQVRLARHDGAERAAVDAARPRGDVLVRPAAAVRRRGPGARGGRLAQLARTNRRRALLILALLRANVAVRVQLQRRRRARLLPAVAPDRRAARGAGDARADRCSARRDVERQGRRAGFVAAALLVAYAGCPRVSRLPGARSQRATIGRRESSRALTAGLDDRRAILLTDLNWQVQNGLSYFAEGEAARARRRADARRAALRAGARRRQPRHRPRGGR